MSVIRPIPMCVICQSDLPVATKRRIIHPISEVNADVHEFFVSVVSPGYRFEPASEVRYTCRVPCFSNLENAVRHHVALQGLLESLRSRIHPTAIVPPPIQCTTSLHGTPPSMSNTTMVNAPE